jgi:DMSO/TMAO reductase YedYZ heme-binding membrane subunit
VIAVAGTSPSPLWYLTRGSGIVTLVLLTLTICLGVATSVRWRSRGLPRFVVAGLHRNLTLLAVAFLALHVVTTVADGYTPIGVKDAFLPFVSAYRPVWLGLGAIACDLLLALVVTSLLRARVGFRTWRVLHWLAYAAWPVALVHALGTGSDSRFGWMAAIAGACLVAVGLAVVARAFAAGWRPRDAAAVASAAVVALGIGLWYRSGPAKHGWAARAGTPRAILASTSIPPASSRTARRLASLPRTFTGRLSGRLSQSAPDGSGLVTVSIDARLTGTVKGELKLALQGFPVDDGGVSMTASGVAFQGAGPTPLYEGSIVALDGSRVSARLASPSAGAIRLAMVFQIDPRSGAVTGSLEGARA